MNCACLVPDSDGGKPEGGDDENNLGPTGMIRGDGEASKLDLHIMKRTQ